MQTGDAFGEMLRAYIRDGEGVEIVERDDGFITASQLGPSSYLAPFRRWLPVERQATRLARGRVLDIGAASGCTYRSAGSRSSRSTSRPERSS